MHVNNFKIENNESINNLENGIWPTLSANGQVKKNVAYGSLDSALWVEASENVRVINNDLSTSPTGLEVTISKNLTIEDNNVHHNTVGIGLYHPAAAGLESPWPYEDLGNWYIVNNHVHDNNFPNPAQPGSSETAALPPGIGILVLGVDNVDVQQNRIENNNYVGVAHDRLVRRSDGIGFRLRTGDRQRRGIGAELRPGHREQVRRQPHLSPETAPLPPADMLYVDGLAGGLPPGTGNCQSGNKLIKTATPRNPGVTIVVVPPPELVGVDLFPTCQ